MIRKTLAVAALALTGALAACSSGPAQSSLGPFTMTPCKMAWADGRGNLYASWAKAQRGSGGSGATPAAEFSITTTATAVLRTFTVPTTAAPVRRSRPAQQFVWAAGQAS
jgi:hypothetical protein